MRYSTHIAMNTPSNTKVHIEIRSLLGMQGIQSISLMHFTQCKGSRVDESDSLLDFLVIHVVPDPLVRIARDGFPPTTLPFCFELVFHVHHHHHQRGRT